MTEEQKNLLHNVYDEINHIENWDNKNLYKRQDQRLLYCLEVLETLLKQEGVDL